MLQAKWKFMLDWKNESFDEHIRHIEGRDKPIDKETQSIMTSIFVMDLWASEGDYFVSDPYELIEHISVYNLKEAEKIFRKVKGINSDRHVYRQYIKVRNLLITSRSIFNEQHRQVLSSEMIKKLHTDIVAGLGISSEYRTIGAKPAGYDVHYAPPHRIVSRMDALCGFIESIKPNNTRETILLASLFLTEFLLIHPFANGNGRVARVIFSMLLFGHSVVPVSLSAKRDLYLTALYELDGGSNPPTEFAKFAAKQCDITSRTAHYLSM